MPLYDIVRNVAYNRLTCNLGVGTYVDYESAVRFAIAQLLSEDVLSLLNISPKSPENVSIDLFKPVTDLGNAILFKDVSVNKFADDDYTVNLDGATAGAYNDVVVALLSDNIALDIIGFELLNADADKISHIMIYEGQDDKKPLVEVNLDSYIFIPELNRRIVLLPKLVVIKPGKFLHVAYRVRSGVDTTTLRPRIRWIPGVKVVPKTQSPFQQQ